MENSAPGLDVAFVIGPGRSGTTLLYKLLCLHPDVAYISNVEQKLPWLPGSVTGGMRLRRYEAKLQHWFQDSGNAYMVERPLLSKAAPVPVEGEAVYERCGIPLFPSPGYQPEDNVARSMRNTFTSLRQASGGAVLISKRTANNRRLPALRSVFPYARYISLIRDGREVADSLGRVGWWDDHPLWWDESRRTPAEAARDGEDMLGLCARNWVRELEEIQSGLDGLDSTQVLEVRYERLLESPVEELGDVMNFLGLERHAEYDKALMSLGLSSREGAWKRRWSPSQVAMVNAVQGAHLARLGYVT